MLVHAALLAILLLSQTGDQQQKPHQKSVDMRGGHGNVGINDGSVTNYNDPIIHLPSPSAEDRVLALVKKKSAWEMMQKLMLADPDGATADARARSEDVLTKVGKVPSLNNNHDVCVLLGKAYDLKFKCLITDYRNHPTDPSNVSRRVAIQDAFDSALDNAKKVEDCEILITMRQRYSAFLDEVGARELADGYFRDADAEFSQLTVAKTTRFVRMITFDSVAPAKLKAAVPMVLKGITNLTHFARAQHFKSLTLRTSSASAKAHLRTAMMKEIDSTIQGLKGEQDTRQLAHAYQWRSGTILSDYGATQKQVEQALYDSREAERYFLIVQQGPERFPISVCWEEGAKCANSEVQALFRLARSSKSWKELHEAIVSANTVCSHCPSDASLPTLSQIMNGLGAVCESLADGAGKPGDREKLQLSAALAFTLAEVCDARAITDEPYVSEAMARVPAAAFASARSMVGELRGATLRTAIAENDDLWLVPLYAGSGPNP